MSLPLEAELLEADPRLKLIVDILQDKKGFEILLMDLRALSDAADFFVLCTGNSDQHLKSMAEDLRHRLKAAGHPVWHLEGMDTCRWVLLDYVDIVVHLFRRDAREFYALERLWGDAESLAIEDSWDVSAQPSAF